MQNGKKSHANRLQQIASMVEKLGTNPKFSPSASKRTQRKLLKMSKLPISQYLKKY
jgi:hypothetical protein